MSVSPGTNTLRAAIAALPATPTVEYHLLLGAGTYNDIQLNSKARISIEGAGVGSTVIVTDGTRTDVDPVSGQRYVDMAEHTKHGIAAKTSFSMRNLTWQMNDVKYVIHDDWTRGDSLVEARNVAFIADDTFCVGVGASNSARSTYTASTFTTAGTHGMFWHNNLSQTAGASLDLVDCTFSGTGVLTLSELGPSGISDAVTVTRCVTDQIGAGDGIYINAASAGLPYAIEIIQNGGTMPAFDFNAATRPDAASHFTLNP